MDLGLEGARVLVVGARGGIGSSVVSSLDQEGATTVLASSNPPEDGYLNDGGSPIVRIDLRDSTSIKEGLADAVTHLGALDSLVVSASVNSFASFWDLDRDIWREQFEIKYLGIAELCRESVQYIEPGGSLILISGIAGVVPFASNPAGGAVNAALEHLIRLLTIELSTIPVRVVGVSPGMTRTTRLESFSEGQLEQIESDIPLARIADPHEIADVVVFLVSNRASYITGTTVVIDGGRTLTGQSLPTRQLAKGVIKDV